MCSIIGASSKGETIPFDDMKILYLQGQSRGGDACGFTNGKKCIKMATDSYDYVNSVMKREDFPKENNFFIGHTRYATFGKSSENKNAHPFGKKSLIGVHNGSIFNHEDLSKLVDTEAEVDSEVLYDCIDKYGIKKVLPLVSGILALVWYVPKQDKIYVYRNGRPLVYGKKGDIMYWASEEHYLLSIGCKSIKEFREHTIYQIKNGRIVSAKNQAKKLEPSLPLVNQNTKKYIKESTLDIFKDRQTELKALKDDEVNEQLKKFREEEQKKKEEKEKKKKEKETKEVKAKSKTGRSVIVYQDSSLMQPPMNARLFLDETHDDSIFAWFHPEMAYVLCIWEKNYGCFREYDILNEEDNNRFYENFANKTTEIFEWVQTELLHLEMAMEKRNDLFKEKNETDVFSKFPE